MSKFPSLGENANVPDILRMRPDAGVALMELHEAVMRGPSALSQGERELIAAQVSALNNCHYCYGMHAEAAMAHGVPEATIRGVLADIDSADVRPALKPILHYVRKITERADGATEDDARAVYDADWDEQALNDAIMVACCFNFMNRLLEGHGVEGNDAMFRERGPMVARHGYTPLIRMLDPARAKSA
ncbi:peroxidase [Maritimibacter sp. 55A14]|uniref:carboxymuconolactone decarboxylase family protein n=1 Tax=Maritimibacter sp. 55A14 TaxID=2174844 RepID=UPI000D621C78|nr:peroxidase-related enzyme [Maritimibacter sp. 55A14]PWE32017.1 peroxidase [Maritimibacter sp. 55A14]